MEELLSAGVFYPLSAPKLTKVEGKLKNNR